MASLSLYSIVSMDQQGLATSEIGGAVRWRLDPDGGSECRVETNAESFYDRLCSGRPLPAPDRDWSLQPSSPQ